MHLHLTHDSLLSSAYLSLYSISSIIYFRKYNQTKEERVLNGSKSRKSFFFSLYPPDFSIYTSSQNFYLTFFCTEKLKYGKNIHKYQLEDRSYVGISQLSIFPYMTDFGLYCRVAVYNLSVHQSLLPI